MTAVPDEIYTCARDRCTTPSDTRLIAPPPDPQHNQSRDRSATEIELSLKCRMEASRETANVES